METKRVFELLLQQMDEDGVKVVTRKEIIKIIEGL